MATIKHGNLAIADVAVIIGYILGVIVVGMSSFIVIDFVYGWSCKSFLKIAIFIGKNQCWSLFLMALWG